MKWSYKKKSRPAVVVGGRGGERSVLEEHTLDGLLEGGQAIAQSPNVRLRILVRCGRVLETRERHEGEPHEPRSSRERCLCSFRLPLKITVFHCERSVPI